MTETTKNETNELDEAQQAQGSADETTQDQASAQVELQNQLTEKEAKIEALQKALDLAKKNETEAMARAQAELANVRKRLEQEADKARKYALEKFSTSLLDVVDNLERALTTLDTSNESHQPIIAGIELTLKSFLDTLKKFGVEVIESTNKSLNPELHQAITMVDSPEHASNQIVDTMQKGYTLHGRLIRPAMVIVAK